MKKLILMLLAGFATVVAGTGISTAQDDGMLILPVEMYACSYNDRQGPDDLDDVIGKFNSWADSKNIDSYSAWTLTPYYFSPNQEFDVIWLGAAKNAAAMGRAQDTYLSDNDGLMDDFNEVWDCGAHIGFASINHKAPPGGETPEGGVLSFADCTFHEGATFTALNAAMQEWSQYLTDAGSNAAIFHWYPAYGGGAEEFDFKWVTAHESLADMGADFERYTNDRGFVTRGRLLNHLIDCDANRVYLTQSRRYVQLR